MADKMMASAARPLTNILPPLGEEVSIFLHGINSGARAGPLQLRHGSSLSLVSAVCTFLADPSHEDSFNFVDPTADHEKWSGRGMDLYYAAILDPSTDSVLCALRAVTDGVRRPLPLPHPPRPRFVIDYVYTEASSRGGGLANRLVEFILTTTDAFGANCYVLSLEESCVYWMEKHGFFLCDNPNLNARLNVFPDTHLLRRGSDPPDDGDPADLAMQIVHDDDDDDEEGSEDEEGSDDAAPQLKFSCALDAMLKDQPTPRTDSFRRCLNSIALLVNNARESSPGDKRRSFKLSNPVVRERVFGIGRENAMEVLLACGFELGIDGNGETIMEFKSGESGGDDWLARAIERLEEEASR